MSGHLRTTSWSRQTWTRRRLGQSAVMAMAGMIATSAARASAEDALPSPGADGNRLISGKGRFPRVTPVDVALPGPPRRITGLLAADGVITWVVVLDAGGVQAWRSREQQLEPVSLAAISSPDTLPVDSLPTLIAGNPDPELLVLPDHLAPSLISLPAQVEGVTAFIDESGDLVLVQDDALQTVTARYAVNALPDAHVLHDATGRVLTLSGATTDRYVLGDDLEASGFGIARVSPPAPIQEATLDDPNVIEGLAPIWVDIDGDGQRELVVTLSNAAEGGRLAILSEAGTVLALGPGFGRRGRWRHPLAVAPFGPEGESEIAAVRTPHIGGVVEFSRWESDTLTTVAELPGYSSHGIGSRNLDMALAADFDGDGQLELLIPDQDRTGLAGIRRTRDGDGAEAAWQLPLDGTLTTNLIGVTSDDGELHLAAGRDDGVLRFWLAD